MEAAVQAVDASAVVRVAVLAVDDDEVLLVVVAEVAVAVQLDIVA